MPQVHTGVMVALSAEPVLRYVMALAVAYLVIAYPASSSERWYCEAGTAAMA
jgi:hypothetical protein